MNSPTPTNQSKQEELREQIVQLLSRDDGVFFKGYTIYEPRIDDLMQLIQSHDEARNQKIRLDDRIARIMTQQYDQGWAAGWAQRAKEEDYSAVIGKLKAMKPQDNAFFVIGEIERVVAELTTHPNEHGEE